MNRMRLTVWLCVMVAGALSSCSHNINPYLSEQFDFENLHRELDTNPVNLAENGRCPGARKLHVVNEETSKEKVKIAVGAYLVPAGYADLASRYLTLKLEEGGVPIDATSGKEVRVSLGEIHREGKGYPFRFRVTLNLSIPEISYAKGYEGTGESTRAWKAVANGTHRAIMEFLNDPAVQAYIGCR